MINGICKFPSRTNTIKGARRAIIALSAAATLAGCAGHGGVHTLMTSEPAYLKLTEERAFAQALRQRYLELATFAFDRGDMDRSDFYSLRSIMAVEGKLVDPANMSTDGLDAEQHEALGRLVVAMQGNLRLGAPTMSARAQAAIDCWIIESTADGDRDVAAACRENALGALAQLEQIGAGGSETRSIIVRQPGRGIRAPIQAPVRYQAPAPMQYQAPQQIMTAPVPASIRPQARTIETRPAPVAAAPIELAPMAVAPIAAAPIEIAPLQQDTYRPAPMPMTEIAPPAPMPMIQEAPPKIGGQYMVDFGSEPSAMIPSEEIYAPAALAPLPIAVPEFEPMIAAPAQEYFAPAPALEPMMAPIETYAPAPAIQVEQPVQQYVAETYPLEDMLPKAMYVEPMLQSTAQFEYAPIAAAPSYESIYPQAPMAQPANLIADNNYESVGLAAAAPTGQYVVASTQPVTVFSQYEDAKSRSVSAVIAPNLIGAEVTDSMVSALNDQEPSASVYFSFDSAEVTPEALDLVADIAERIKNAGARNVTLFGLTDSQGDPRYNQLLAMRRAQAVRKQIQAIVGDGVTFEITPLGEAASVAEGDELDNALFRRVDVVFG